MEKADVKDQALLRNTACRT